MTEQVAESRLIVFAVVLVSMAVIESLWPRRDRTEPRTVRWRGNLLLSTLNAVILKVMEPISAAAIAIFASERGWGLLPRLKWGNWQLTQWGAIVLTVVLFDLLIYGQHRLSHRFHWFWRLHRVHHADHDFDVTTGIRFHPVEIALSMLLKGVGVLLLGPPVLGVLLFEMILNGSAMFNHSNMRLPGWIEQPLRWVLVTPQMHEVHHSIVREESDQNYGFCLSCWDRLFGSYQQQPGGGVDALTIGLAETTTRETASLGYLLCSPLESLGESTGGGHSPL